LPGLAGWRGVKPFSGCTFKLVHFALYVDDGRAMPRPRAELPRLSARLARHAPARRASELVRPSAGDVHGADWDPSAPISWEKFTPWMMRAIFFSALAVAGKDARGARWQPQAPVSGGREDRLHFGRMPRKSSAHRKAVANAHRQRATAEGPPRRGVRRNRCCIAGRYRGRTGAR
jgi:hypothetical protein